MNRREKYIGKVDINPAKGMELVELCPNGGYHRDTLPKNEAQKMVDCRTIARQSETLTVLGKPMLSIAIPNTRKAIDNALFFQEKLGYRLGAFIMIDKEETLAWYCLYGTQEQCAACCNLSFVRNWVIGFLPESNGSNEFCHKSAETRKKEATIKRKKGSEAVKINPFTF